MSIYLERKTAFTSQDVTELDVLNLSLTELPLCETLKERYQTGVTLEEMEDYYR
jgi:hypothetical protein